MVVVKLFVLVQGLTLHAALGLGKQDPPQTHLPFGQHVRQIFQRKRAQKQMTRELMKAKQHDKLERSMTERARGASLFDRRSYSWEQDFKDDEGPLNRDDPDDKVAPEAIVGREQLEDAASHKDHGMDSVGEDS